MNTASNQLTAGIEKICSEFHGSNRTKDDFDEYFTHNKVEGWKVATMSPTHVTARNEEGTLIDSIELTSKTKKMLEEMKAFL